MARYLVSIYYVVNGQVKPATSFTSRTRPATYNKAYGALYDYLGNVAGRDTAWGWKLVKMLDHWFMHGRSFEHGDKCMLEERGWHMSIQRTE